MKAPVPIVYINNGIALFWGDCLKTDIHSHYALQIAILLEGKYKLFIDNREIEKSVFINSDTPHRHIRQSGKQLSIFIEPESALGGAIRTSCPENYRILTRLKQSDQKREGEKIVEALSSKKLSQEMVENFIREIIPVRIPSRKSDRRIDLLLEKIEIRNRTFPEETSVDQLVAEIPVSPSHLRHLFKNQTGVSIKRYLLWQKVKDGIGYIIEGNNLTTAAFRAGFSDSAHLSRTFREMFGISPMQIQKEEKNAT